MFSQALLRRHRRRCGPGVRLGHATGAFVHFFRIFESVPFLLFGAARRIRQILRLLLEQCRIAIVGARLTQIGIRLDFYALDFSGLGTMRIFHFFKA